MKNKRFIRITALLLAPLLALHPLALSHAADDTPHVLVGVNYFSGWWEPLPNKWHAPSDGSDWRKKYPGRVPLLGEYNTQSTMDKEIEAAAEHGVDFFSILWYPMYGDVEPERNARYVNAGLAQFLASPQAGRMKFMVEVCNHPPFTIKNSEQWTRCIESLLPAFKHPSYLRVGGKSVLKIHSGHHFHVDSGGDVEKQKAMLDQLRLAVRKAGLGEMFIGCGVTGGEAVGRDWPTARLYDFTNTYMDVPKLEAKPEDYPYAELAKHIRQCNAKAAYSVLPYVPFISAGWNPRPWKDPRPAFTFPTREEFAAELRQVATDIEKYPNFGLPLPDGGRQKLFTVYAWNEFGEGGIVAPTRGEKFAKLEAIRDVFPSNNETRKSTQQ
jgi:hypothetical protein